MSTRCGLFRAPRIVCVGLGLGLLLCRPATAAQSLPPGFVYVHDVSADIVEDIRYATAHNFVGRPIAGYQGGRCILTSDAAAALAAAQADFAAQHLTLKVYDCYRPQKAVRDFVAWLHDPADQVMKAEFYPNVDKAELFSRGYLSSHSRHCQGRTVDLTLVPWPLPPTAATQDNSIEMGTGFDLLDPRAATHAPIGVSDTAQQNRRLLRRIMRQHGFTNYAREWWHFTFNAAVRGASFDFDVE